MGGAGGVAGLVVVEHCTGVTRRCRPGGRTNCRLVQAAARRIRSNTLISSLQLTAVPPDSGVCRGGFLVDVGPRGAAALVDDEAEAVSCVQHR